MKKHLLHLFILSFLVLAFGSQQAIAQEKKASKVHITITEDDKVTTDTTFELKEGQDPETIKKVLMHMAGDDMHEMHVSKDVHMSHDGDHKMVWISEDDEHLMHIDEDMHGKHGEMMFIESDEDGEVVHIKKMKSGNKVIMITDDGDMVKQHNVTVHTSDGDSEGKETNVKVIVISDEDGESGGEEKTIEIIIDGDENVEWVEKGDGDENVEVYMIKTDDGEDVKVITKKIIVKVEEDAENEKEPATSEKKKTKKKK